MKNRKQTVQELPQQQEQLVGKDQQAIRIDAQTFIITKKCYNAKKRAAQHMELVEKSRKIYTI